MSNSILSKSTGETYFGKKITREECEMKILERFPDLKNENYMHNYFCSYDFHPNEKYIYNFWKNVLIYLNESVFQSFCISIDDILEHTKIKNRRPIGLKNIIKDLINSGEFVLLSTIKTDEYFKNNYKELYGKESWGSWIKGNIMASFNIFSSQNDNTTHDCLINKRLFKEMRDQILEIISDEMRKEHTDVLTKPEIKQIIYSFMRISETHLNICLEYLSKIKKIEIFKANNDDVESIKLLRTHNSKVTEKDKAIITINYNLKTVDKKLNDTQKMIVKLSEEAKRMLDLKNRDAAKNCLLRKKNYAKQFDHYMNLKLTLEQNLLDIESMETNKGVKEILEKVVITVKELQINPDNMYDLKEKIDMERDKNIENNNIFKEYANDNIEVRIFLFFRMNP